MGGWEWAILVLIALLLLGGSRLSGIGRTVGKAVREFSEETSAVRPAVDETTSATAIQEAEPELTPAQIDDVVDAELVVDEPEPETTGSTDRPGED